MCCGCNPTTAFSWLGGILINSSFIALISWGTAVLWPLGLGLAVLYTALLFFGARWGSKRKPAPPPVATDVVLLLFVMGVGASGSILAYNVVGCDSPYSASYSGSSAEWVFPTSAAASNAEVLKWAAQDRWSSGSRATFAFEPTSASSLFSGRNSTVSNSWTNWLWLISPSSAAPECLFPALENPDSFVTVEAGATARVCFSAYIQPSAVDSTTLAASASTPSGTAVHCYQPSSGSVSVLGGADGAAAPVNPGALLSPLGSSDLWFKADAPFGMTPNGACHVANLPVFAAC